MICFLFYTPLLFSIIAFSGDCPIHSSAITGFAPNDPDYAWDGTFRGQEVNVGVYIFFAEIEFVDGRKEILRGDISVLK